MTFTKFSVVIFLMLSASLIAARGLPAKSDSKTKIENPEKPTPAVPEDEVAMEDRRRTVATAESDEGAAGESQEDASIYEAELMSGDDGSEEDDDPGSSASDDTSSDSQHLFPSFSSLFAPPPPPSLSSHSRPFYQTPVIPTSARAFAPSSVYHRSIYSANDDTERVLGSGNFGVIRGGTYYGGGAADEPYTRGSNSHGRPYRRPNPLPQFRHGGDFFSGFRDFADITTAPKTAYSEIYVVYANRNTTSTNGDATSSPSSTAPKNIRDLIERDGDDDKLAFLNDNDHHDASIKSKTKRKLSLHKKKTTEKEALKKFRSPKEFEPLLALS